MAKGLRDAQGQPIRCSAETFDYSYSYYQCQRNASIIRNGKPYCGTHDPVRRAEKRKARDEAWDARYRHEEELRTQRKAEFVRRIAGIRVLPEDEFEKAIAALVDEIISAGCSWYK